MVPVVATSCSSAVIEEVECNVICEVFSMIKTGCPEERTSNETPRWLVLRLMIDW